MADEDIVDANNTGDGDGAGSSDDATKLGETLSSTQEDLKATKAMVEDLQKQLSAKQDNSLFTDKFLKTLLDEDEGDGGGGDSRKSGDTTLDLDTMSNTDITKYILDEVKAGRELSAKDLKAELTQLNERLNQGLGVIDLELTKVKNPDFALQLEDDNLKGRAIAIAQDNPSWGSERVSKQLKMELALEEKEADAAARAKANSESNLITEKGSGMPSKAVMDKDMTATEAADLAFRNSFGDNKFVEAE